ncbi:metal-response element-binding transcription factor 2-like [Tachypleus tridentatus]|uniref:metal-response element-binding transcription factor 2-like n=1 Tax=Tachypleus tridentatus TaxID=6853 RepID=UPI003FD60F30
MSEERLNTNDLEGLKAENGWLRKTESNHKEESIWTTQEKCLSLECPEKNLGQSRKKRKFREGLDVLCRWTDGLLYLGVIIKVEEKLKKALVRFEDSSEYWTLFKDMQRGNMSGGEIVCVKCENGQSDPPNEIVICDHCNLGYHQHCHRPKISSEVLKPEVPWYCRSCIFASTAKKGGAVKKGLYGQVMQQMKMTLPYDLYTLTWDAQHKFNSEQCYCYCGGPGEWYLKMLQCCRCKQWFHEACLQCLDFPLLFGDRFYIFVCSVCKGGPEFISRLALKWIDVAHLIMFNLTIQNNKKYFDIDSSIISFLNSNWLLFQLQGEPATVPEDKRREIILSALHNNRSRFKCGKEIKKKTTLWGLRVHVPPPAPSVILPATDPLSGNATFETRGKPKKTRDSTHFSMKKNCMKSFDSSNDSSTSTNGQKINEMFNGKDAFLAYFVDTCDVVTMLQGKVYATKEVIDIIFNNEESDKEFEPDDNENLLVMDESDNEDIHGLESVPTLDLLQRKIPKSSSSRCRYSGQCFTSKQNISDSDDASSRSTLDTIIPPPTNFEGINHPFRELDQPVSSTQHSQPMKSQLNEDEFQVFRNGEFIKNVKRRRKRENNTKMTWVNLCGNKRLTVDNGLENSLVSISKNLNLSRDDLYTSVSNYLGSTNRITRGEKFRVLARRVTLEGIVQYLIEWGGTPT